MNDQSDNTPITRQQLADIAADELPVCKTIFGAVVQLVDDDVTQIEDMAALGAEIDYIACELALDLRSFKHCVKVSERIQTAFKRGKARDRHEYLAALRAKSLEMSSPILSIWHGKQQFNMTDKQAIKHTGNTVLTVATGVPMATSPDDKPPIEHDSQD